MTNDVDKSLWTRFFSKWYSQLVLAFLAGLGAVAGRSIAIATGVGDGTVILANATLLAGAATFAGGLLGFLFGVPRILRAQSASLDTTSRELVESNTNLEQISDWLTKIIVGVSLVEARSLGSALQSVAAYFAPGVGGSQSSAIAFAGAVIVYFSIAGFLTLYLWTRLYLYQQFENRLENIRKAAGDGS